MRPRAWSAPPIFDPSEDHDVYPPRGVYPSEMALEELPWTMRQYSAPETTMPMPANHGARCGGSGLSPPTSAGLPNSAPLFALSRPPTMFPFTSTTSALETPQTTTRFLGPSDHHHSVQSALSFDGVSPSAADRGYGNDASWRGAPLAGAGLDDRPSGLHHRRRRRSSLVMGDKEEATAMRALLSRGRRNAVLPTVTVEDEDEDEVDLDNGVTAYAGTHDAMSGPPSPQPGYPATHGFLYTQSVWGNEHEWDERPCGRPEHESGLALNLTAMSLDTACPSSAQLPLPLHEHSDQDEPNPDSDSLSGRDRFVRRDDMIKFKFDQAQHKNRHELFICGKEKRAQEYRIRRRLGTS